MVTHNDVRELLEGRGFAPYEVDNPTVFNIVVERMMEERGIDDYHHLYEVFSEAGYELDYDTFWDDCQAYSDVIRDEFVHGMFDVLELEEEEQLAFAWAILWGRKPLDVPA